MERLDLLKGVSNLGHSAGTGMHKTTRKSSVVDFEQILKESLGDEFVHTQQPAFSALEHADTTEMVRCGGDAIAFHVPEAIKRKIRQHEFMNLAVLLKGVVELSELYGSNLISLNDKGQLETRPKSVTDKITSIARWTDAFLIFSSIYLLEYPQRTQEILKYMSLIREAAACNAGFGWRHYDEQFRL